MRGKFSPTLVSSTAAHGPFMNRSFASRQKLPNKKPIHGEHAKLPKLADSRVRQRKHFANKAMVIHLAQ